MEFFEIAKKLKKDLDNTVEILYQGYQTISQSLNERIYEQNEEKETVEEKSNEYYLLRETLIKKLWGLPELLRQYGITENEINHVLPNKQTKFNMDAIKISVIYNNIMTDFSAKTQYEMGIIDEHGNLRINPVDFCYPTPTETKSDSVNSDCEILEIVNTFCEGEITADSDTVEKEILYLYDKIKELRDKISSGINTDVEVKLFSKLLKDYFVLKIDSKKITSLKDISEDDFYNCLSFEDKVFVERCLFNS